MLYHTVAIQQLDHGQLLYFHFETIKSVKYVTTSS